MAKLYTGTSGLLTTIPKRDFPPAQQHLSRLGFYALHNNSIEINSTFYKLPQAATITRWAAEVPGSFRFTFKLWRELSHQPGLRYPEAAIAPFFRAIAGADGQRGCILVQFPPGLRAEALPRLQELLPLLAAPGWPLAVEFRHPSWYRDSVYALLQEHGAALVLQDMPRSATPMELTSDELVYVRFHGPEGRYQGSYGRELLSEYAEYIREWQADGRTVYVYFNNTAGAALENLATLRSFLER